MDFAFKEEKIDVQGHELTLREMSARQRQEIFKLYQKNKDPVELQAHYVRMGCIEFKDKTADQILDHTPGNVLDELSNAIITFNGLDAEATEEAEKNS